MSEVAIAELLENDLAAYDLVVQVNQEDDCLLVTLNRLADSDLDYPTLTEAIATRIHTLDLPDIHTLLLCSRVLGEYDADWQTEIQLIASRLEPLSATTQAQEEISFEVESFVEESETIQTAAPIFSDTSEAETTVAESSVTPITSEPTSKSEFAPETTVETPALTEKEFQSNYCFTRNKALITRKILPPDEKLAELVQSFHTLPDNDKEAILPLLEEFFRSAEPVTTEQFNPEVQQWFAELTQLKESEIRTTTIWFSRYCFDPEKTMAEVMEVIDFKAVKAAAVEESTQEQIASPETSTTATTPRRTSPLPTTRTNAAATKKTLRATNKLTLLLPIAWTIFTIIAIAIAVRSVNPTEAVANACRNATGKQEYCRLAVQLVGELTFHEESQAAAPLTEIDKEHGIEACERLGNIRAGKTLENSKIPVLSSSGEEVIPGIFIADVKQTNFKQAGSTVRTACVFVNAKEESEDKPAETPTKTQLTLLGSDSIPNNWSNEPYKGQSLAQESIRKAFGIHNIFINIGAGTIFTAIGIFVAAMFSLGIRVDSLTALYQAALCFGVIEAIGTTAPIGWFGGIAFNVLCLGIISAFIRGFHVLWTEGYPTIAAGAIAIIAIKAILNIALLCLIAALIN